MNLKPNSRLRVTADYAAPFPDPIRARAGDTVTIDPDKKTDIPGWLWCTGRAGKGGWVPESYLERQGDSARLRCDYDAAELTVHAGDLLTFHRAESGFYWTTDRSGRQGWVPADHVAPATGRESEAK